MPRLMAVLVMLVSIVGCAGGAGGAGAPAEPVAPNSPVSGSPGAAAGKRVERPPHVVLILADDLGIELRAYGRERVPTPRIDAFAAQGLVFERAYAASPVCCPARSAIYSGLYPHANGMFGFRESARLFDGVPVLTKILGDAGYFVAGMGKIHVFPPDRFEWSAPLLPKLDRGDAKTAAEGVRTLLRAGLASGKPVFLLVGLSDPHLGAVPEDIERNFAKTDPASIVFEPDGIETPVEREVLAGYMDGLRRTDAVVGAVLDAIAEAGLADEALVVLTGDHGSPELGGKRALYEKGVRVPLIARWPGRVAAGARVGGLAGTFDLLPTVLDLAGAGESARGLHGVSLRETLLAGKEPPREAIMVTNTLARGPYYYPSRALVDDEWKYIRNLRPDREAPLTRRNDVHDALPHMPPAMQEFARRRLKPPAEELYFLPGDPYELTNLAADPRHAGRLAAMRTALRAELDRTGDRFIELWDLPPGAPDRFEARFPSVRHGDVTCPLCDDED